MSINQSDVKACLDEICSLCERSDLDSHSSRALAAIKHWLMEIATGGVWARSEQAGVISRLVVEQDPTVLSPAFGGRLIAIEKALYGGSFPGRNA